MIRHDSSEVTAAKRLVDSSHWFFRAYIAGAVGGFFVSMLCPATCRIYHDASSLYLLLGFAAVVWLSVQGIDRVSHGAQVGPAAAFAIAHSVGSMLVLGAFVCAWLYLFREPRGLARFELVGSASVIGALLLATCARAVRIAFACSYLEIEVARGYCHLHSDHIGVLDN